MRLLVVEDEHRLALALQRGLTEEGHAVDIVHDGEQAVFFACTTAYEVLLLDLQLPHKDGLHVCRELRGAGVSTPILMVTAKGSVAEKIEGLNMGADDYLAKPFAFGELLARVNALGRRRTLDRSPILRVADLELDPATREVRRGNQSLSLTNREFALLSALMRRPGQVLTRTQIADQIWDLTVENDSNVIDVYIRMLRRKIDQGREHPLIYTVRGVGYAIKG